MRNFKGLIGLGRHLVSAACLLFVLAASTSAYSIVMRGGKRLEIPAQFNVTNTTLSYETAPGFWITLQMAAVDIPATEKANNEVPGSLMARAIKQRESAGMSERTSQPRQPKASRSITNRDLESFRQARVESERALEQTRKEQGLPPLAVMRAQAAADAKRFSEELAKQQAEAEANERALQLQAQIAALNAQMSYLQSGGGQVSFGYPDAYGYYGGVPFFGGHSRAGRGLFNAPLGWQFGGAFTNFSVPFGSFSHGFRRNIVVAPGRSGGGRGGFRGGSHGGGGSRGGGGATVSPR